MNKHEVLKSYFGHLSFREGQEGLIDAVLAGRDVFGIMPTGGGKSLCYQIPAIMSDGAALVVSPLISLMKDQVMALKNAGIKAAFINSSLNSEQLRLVYRNTREGMYKIVYIAPERLLGEGFISVACDLEISLIAVDEAHCISQWGQDFRPSYLKITEFLDKLPKRPVLTAFTATATKPVREDIERILNLRDPLRLTTGFGRPNLKLEVLKPKSKPNTLRALISSRRNKSGIVYCSTRKTVERVSEELNAAGILAAPYHAGLGDDERRRNQDDFIHDRKPVMVATNAFGMGIDKSNVSYVIHYNMPKSLEAYYEEAGRAGRDGENADCILMYSGGDINTAKFLIENSVENDELSEDERRFVTEQDYKRLDMMVGYCKTEKCLSGYILDYFDQTPGKNCGNCGNCLSEYSKIDITNEAQKILSCVKRAGDKLGYNVGATLIVQTLSGSSSIRILALGLDKLTTYGIMKGVNRAQIKEYIERLETAGYLRTDKTYGSLELTENAKNVLFNGEKVFISVKKLSTPEKIPGKKTFAPHVASAGTVADSGDSTEPELFETLRVLRYKLAQEESVPAYIVFSNATLADMAKKAPKNMAEFLEVAGVGQVKAERYGQVFLDAIASWDK